MNYFVSLESRRLSDDEAKTLQSPKTTGVLLFGRNIGNQNTTKKLIGEIKSVNKDLEIAIDEEGGIVSRLAHLTPGLSQPFVAELSGNQIVDFYRKRAEFMAALGITVNFAPVVDLAPSDESVMYKRSFGSTPEKVIQLAQICIVEQRRVGVASCLKHFPGHGFTSIDSHETLPRVDQSFETWLECEGKIFGELILNSNPEYIMVGHIQYPKVEERPASLSPKWVSEILKQKLKYTGRILSDDIDMKALPKDLSEKDFEVAGIDTLISTVGFLAES